MGRDAIAAKIDRALFNGEWMQKYPSFKAHFSEPILSDHCAIEISLTPRSHTRPKPFRFYNSWVDHENYREIVKRSWEEEVEGYPMFKVSKN